MKLNLIAQKLTEMSGPAQVCPKCGHGPIHKTHTYNAKNPNDKWKCKLPCLPGYPQAGGSTQSTPASKPAPSQIASPVALKPTPVAAPTPAATATPTVVHTPGATRAVTRTPEPADKRKAVEWFISRYTIPGSKINEDLSIDAEGSVDLTGLPYDHIPVKFGKITGDFAIHAGHIESLKNFPTEVTEDVYVMHTNITSFEGMCSVVGGSCHLIANEKVTSIDGLPSKIGGSLSLAKCKSITSLKGIHKIVQEVDGEIDCSDTGVKEAVLGLLMIDGVTDIKLPDNKVTEILVAQLKSEDRDPHEAQEQLIDAGFVAAAKM